MQPDPERDAQLSRWLKAVEDAPLDSRSSRYVTLDGSLMGAQGVRGSHVDVKDYLFDVITLADASEDHAATCQLFSGFRGTGKSTELLRLKSSLEQSGYVVLYADIEDYHSLARDVTIEELLYIIAGALGDAAAEELGRPGGLQSGWDAIRDFFSREVQLEPAAIRTLGPFDFKAGLKKNDSFLARLRDALEGRLEELQHEAHRYAADTIGRVQAARGGASVVFILDNLERLDPPEGVWLERMRKLVDVFAGHADALRLSACHTIYSVPLYLERMLPNLDHDYDGDLQILPTVKVTHTRDAARTRFQPGLDALRKVLAERLPLDEIFETDAQIDKLLSASGGHLRGLLKMTSTIIRLARRSALPVPDRVVDRAISQHAEKLRGGVRADGITILDGIRRTFSLDRVTDADFVRLARYLDSSLVHCYRNGEGWYDVHPLLVDHIERLAAAREAR